MHCAPPFPCVCGWGSGCGTKSRRPLHQRTIAGEAISPKSHSKAAPKTLPFHRLGRRSGKLWLTGRFPHPTAAPGGRDGGCKLRAVTITWHLAVRFSKLHCATRPFSADSSFILKVKSHHSILNVRACLGYVCRLVLCDVHYARCPLLH